MRACMCVCARARVGVCVRERARERETHTHTVCVGRWEGVGLWGGGASMFVSVPCLLTESQHPSVFCRC